MQVVVVVVLMLMVLLLMCLPAGEEHQYHSAHHLTGTLMAGHLHLCSKLRWLARWVVHLPHPPPFA
jgi:hypothetical protein